MKLRISLKLVLVSILIVLGVFLPNSIDINLGPTIGGVPFRLLRIITLAVVCVLLWRSAQSRRLKVQSGRIRGFSAAVFLMIGGILASLAYQTTFESAFIRAIIRDTVPIILPLLVAWVLHLDAWRREDFLWVLRLLMICAVLVVLVDIMLVLNYAPLYGIFGWKMSTRTFSTRPNQAVGSAIAIAALLSLVLPIALLLQKQGRGIWRIPHLICPWILLVGIALQASRLATTTVLLYLFLSTGGAKRTGGRVARMAALCTLLILVFVAYDFIGSFFQRYTILRNASAITRAQSGIIGLRIFSDNPIFGTGIGVFYPRNADTVTQMGVVYVAGLGEKLMIYKQWATLADPHDVYVMWLAELGAVGAIGLIACFWVLARYCIRVIRLAKRTGTDTSLFRAFGSGLILLCMQFFGASFLLNNDRMSIFIWIYVALALEAGRRTIATAMDRRRLSTEVAQLEFQKGRQSVA